MFGLTDEQLFGLMLKKGGKTPSESQYQFSIENAVARSFIDTARQTYASNPTISISDQYDYDERNDIPVSYKIDNLSDGTFVLIDNHSGRAYSQPIIDGSAEITNLTPNTDYTLISTTYAGERQLLEKVIPTGDLCMFDVYKLNFRDIGGWSADGGTIKYGLIIRGSALNEIAVKHPHEADVLRNQIGIQVDIDLRKDGLDTFNLVGESEISPLVEYYNYPMKSGYSSAIKATGSDLESCKSALNTIMDSVIDGKTTYIHCVQGADRTGTVLWLIEGLLGVSEIDRDIDYELTTLCGVHKHRDSTNFVSTKSAMSAYDDVFDWYRKMNLSIDKLNAFRHKMIDGTPSIIPDGSGKINVLATAINTDGSIYNNVGYKTQTRVSSENIDTALSSSHSDVYASGYIAVSSGTTLIFENINIANNNSFDGYVSSYYNVLMFDADFNLLYNTSQYNLNKPENNCVVEGDFIREITLNNISSKVDMNKLAYIRFTMVVTGVPAIYKET